MLVPLLTLAMMNNEQQVSVCDVLRRPSVYRNQLIAVRAEVLLALPHGAILLNKDCPKAGLRLGVDLPEAESSATNLVPSVLNDCSEPKMDRVPGIFRGKLAFDRNGFVELRLMSVDEIQIHPCPKP
jgi:hypothetical protein